jgi:prepilin peptidase CpaA
LLHTFNNIAFPFRMEPQLLLPLLLTLGIAWQDLKTRRIPNYLTLGTVLAGLGYQLGSGGWSGLHAGFLGLAVGFILLFVPYLLGGLGGGDVKALAALGAWLGPVLILHLFVYVAVCGGLMALGNLCARKLIWARIYSIKNWVVNGILCRPCGMTAAACSSQTARSIPYGVAMAFGMVLLLIKGA